MEAKERFGATPKRRRPGRAKGTRISVQAPERITALVVRYELAGTVLTWRDLRAAMAKKTGISFGLGTLERLANGIEPKSARLRRALGLPALGLGEICPVHGRVCAVKHHLPDDRPRKPRRQWKKDYARARALLERALTLINNTAPISQEISEELER